MIHEAYLLLNLDMSLQAGNKSDIPAWVDYSSGDRNRTALIAAAVDGQHEIAEWLIREGPQIHPWLPFQVFIRLTTKITSRDNCFPVYFR